MYMQFEPIYSVAQKTLVVQFAVKNEIQKNIQKNRFFKILLGYLSLAIFQFYEIIYVHLVKLFFYQNLTDDDGI